jgi:hypothetical protein
MEILMATTVSGTEGVGVVGCGLEGRADDEVEAADSMVGRASQQSRGLAGRGVNRRLGDGDGVGTRSKGVEMDGARRTMEVGRRRVRVRRRGGEEEEEKKKKMGGLG